MRFLACCFLVGCTAGSGGFEDAVPNRSLLTLHVPEAKPLGTSSLNQALLGERATFYTVTRQTTSDFNNGLGGFLAGIQSIVTQPPSQESGPHAVWGPTNDALATSNYRFEAEKTAPGSFNYAFSAKLKSEPDTAWQMVVQGAGHRVDDAHALGEIHVHNDLARRYDDTNHADQNYAIHFDSTVDPRVVDIYFDKAGIADAEYHYTEAHDGSGSFQFSHLEDLDGDGTLETLAIVSRWLASGAGRADVVAKGGSLTGQMGMMGMTECWDASFGRTFYAENGNVVEGDPATCAY
jgi:hypothetical protein